MKFTLKDYQRDAVDDVLRNLEHARTIYHRDGQESSFSLTATTGAGKTVMAAAAIEALFYGSEEFEVNLPQWPAMRDYLTIYRRGST